MPLNDEVLTSYRNLVRAFPCPACNAGENEPCKKLMIEHDQRDDPSTWVRVGSPVLYVHDDRSAIQFMSAINELQRVVQPE